MDVVPAPHGGICSGSRYPASSHADDGRPELPPGRPRVFSGNAVKSGGLSVFVNGVHTRYSSTGILLGMTVELYYGLTL